MTARRSPIGRARGHGSAKEGAATWWHQRLSAVALVPLGFWFAASMVAHTGDSQPEVVEWLASRRTAVMMALLIVATFYHFKLGMQVVIEDYVENQVLRLASLVLVNFSCIALTFIGIISVLKLALGG
jgi:succinate dehydrogenase / fumarate reductase membrane anchor subunit